jgi:hypothetical protein
MILGPTREASINSLKLVLCAFAAVLITGLLVLKAEAKPLTGAIDPHALGKIHSGGAGRVHVRHAVQPQGQ